MGLSEYLRDDLIFLELHPRDMRECLQLMVERSAERGAVADQADALERLIQREATMSTGMGSGVAVPHAKSSKCRGMVVALGLVPEGVDFKAIDGRPVHIVFMLLGPPDSTREHVDLLARIAQLVRSPGVLESLRAATEPSQVVESLRAEGRLR